MTDIFRVGEHARFLEFVSREHASKSTHEFRTVARYNRKSERTNRGGKSNVFFAYPCRRQERGYGPCSRISLQPGAKSESIVAVITIHACDNHARLASNSYSIRRLGVHYGGYQKAAVTQSIRVAQTFPGARIE
jgi:hypothetical protein